MINLIEKATRFAINAHHGQMRKFTGEPYFHHCIRVAELVEIHGGNDSLIAASLLHDTMEDCNVLYKDLIQEFGKDVARHVFDVTNVYTKANYPKLNREERKILEHNRISKLESSSLLLKLCDRFDNIKDIGNNDDGFKKKYFEETYHMLIQVQEFGKLDVMATYVLASIWDVLNTFDFEAMNA